MVKTFCSGSNQSALQGLYILYSWDEQKKKEKKKKKKKKKKLNAFPFVGIMLLLKVI